MKRCSRCNLPGTVPGISFDTNGICNFCRSYRKEKSIGKEELDRIIESARKEDKKYDCIFYLRGGRDSTYVLYVAKAMYDLKLLTVSIDNEFRVEQSLVNMRRACNKLGVDIIFSSSNKYIIMKCVKYGIRSAVQFCQFVLRNACEYGYRSVVYRSAEEYGAP